MLNIDRDSVSGHAFREIAAAICSGTLAPESIVSESLLSERFGSSRTPLREAIMRLESTGYLRRQRNRTLIVAPLSISEMEQISQTREYLEGLTANLAAQRIAAGLETTEELESIHARIGRLASVGEKKLQLMAGLDFHREIWRLSNNLFATEHLENVVFSLERYRILVEDDNARPSRIHSEHGDFLVALRNGNPEAAERAIRKHLAEARKVYADILSRKAALRAEQRMGEERAQS